MNRLRLNCANEQRRHAVREAMLNGLDYLEVEPDQRTLTVCFLGKAPPDICRENLRIEGGRRVRNIRIDSLRVHRKRDPKLDDCMEVRVDRPGDFSTYTLRVVDRDDPQLPMPGFDPRYDRLQFSFKAGCPSELDCKPAKVCPPPVGPEPEISYLAKDYASLRRLLLDRLAQVMPRWQERHVPDLGIALVELLAYTGDHLSYFQDAVATEAYLDTARQRISVRRHARLVDYAMHDGVNARAWVTLTIEGGDLRSASALAPESFFLITGYDGVPPAGTILTPQQLPATVPRPYEVFEPLTRGSGEPIELSEAHNTIAFYTWGDRECCLPRGATRATLQDPAGPWEPDPDPKGDSDPDQVGGEDPPSRRHRLRLRPGDVLIFEEVKGPRTGVEADADKDHRHAVRLTSVEYGVDELYSHQPIVTIEWAQEDALPFALCISSLGRDCEPISDVSVARGNVVLVDHGRRVAENLCPVPPPHRSRITCQGEGRPRETVVEPGLYRPRLGHGPLVFSEPLPARWAASGMLLQDPRQAVPWIRLTAATPSDQVAPWLPRRDLIASGSHDQHFVVEVDNDGRGQLRFGDGELGLRPEPATVFAAVYRIGHGPEGNVGAGAITHLVLRDRKVDGISITARNPLPAAGGTAAEPLTDVKLLAGHALRCQLQRAITAGDYARLAEQHPLVQRAAARLRWSGCSYKVLVAIDPLGAEEASEELLEEVAGHLHPSRRIGHQVIVAQARYVPLEIKLTVCVKHEYLRSQVRSELTEKLSNRVLADGRRGFFHPDHLSFGEGICLSRLVAAAQEVAGVDNIKVEKCQRWSEGANGEIDAGVLPLGPFEVARLDNDPSFPEYGTLELDLRGGR